MDNIMLVEALSALSGRECKLFSKFVQSPLYNTRTTLISLTEYLLSSMQKGKKPDVKSAFHACYGEETAYNDQKMRLLNSDLLMLLEQFFEWTEKINPENPSAIEISTAYRKRNLAKHFGIRLKAARTEHAAAPFYAAEYFDRSYQIEWEAYQHDIAHVRAATINLQAVSDQLDLAFMARKLRLACLALTNQAVFKTAYELGLIRAVITEVESKNLYQYAAIGVYYHCYRFLSQPDATDDFAALQYLLAQNADQIPNDERRVLYLLAINFGIQKINTESPDWRRVTLDLYKDALTRGLLLENGVLSRFAFGNIVAIALREGQIEWAETFIHTYKPMLEKSWREATASLNIARTAYAKNDYELALKHLQRSDYKDVLNNLTAKTLLLKIWYEKIETDLLESHLKSMRTFIRRHTGMGYHRTNYTNIVVFTEKLMALNQFDPKAVQALKAAIQEEPILTEKEWMLRMLNRC